MATIDDDDSLGDYFRDLRAVQQQQRGTNRERGAEILLAIGVSFESKNFGAHLVVSHAGQTVDYWPGTGKYIFRNRTRKGRGIFRLLRALGIEPVVPSETEEGSS